MWIYTFLITAIVLIITTFVILLKNKDFVFLFSIPIVSLIIMGGVGLIKLIQRYGIKAVGIIVLVIFIVCLIEFKLYTKNITRSGVSKEIDLLFKLKKSQIKERYEKNDKKIPRRGEEHFSISYEIFKGKGDNKRREYLECLVRKYGNKGGFLDNFVRPISVFAIPISIVMSTLMPMINMNQDKNSTEIKIIYAWSHIVFILGIIYFVIAVTTGIQDYLPKEKDRRFYIDEVIPKVLDEMNKEKQKEIHKQEFKQKKSFFQELIDAISKSHR